MGEHFGRSESIEAPGPLVPMVLFGKPRYAAADEASACLCRSGAQACPLNLGVAG